MTPSPKNRKVMMWCAWSVRHNSPLVTTLAGDYATARSLKFQRISQAFFHKFPIVQVEIRRVQRAGSRKKKQAGHGRRSSGER